ncbi:hypothetical protein ABFS83_12G006600 [Erythranthe nasuta]
MAKTQLKFSVLVILFIYFIGVTFAEPQMTNKFIGCTVTINVCKNECKHRYNGWGLCATAAAGPPEPHPTPAGPALMQPLKYGGKKCCPCKCMVRKKPKTNLGRPITPEFASKA